LRTWVQSDLPLYKGYEEGKKFLQEFFGAIRVQSSLAIFIFLWKFSEFFLNTKNEKGP